MKPNENNEQLFKNIAALYVEKEGELLKKELMEIEKEKNFIYPLSLDKKVKNNIWSLKLRKFSLTMMPFAACLLLFAIYSSNLLKVDHSKTPKTEETQKPNIEFLSAKLPEGYELTNIDYDKNKTIYYIVNATNNAIVLTIEEHTGTMETENFQAIHIKDTTVYGLVKKDYNVLTYEKDNILYTLTSRYDYKDLIELSENLI